MNDRQFDDLVREQFSSERGEPSERVWARIVEGRRPWLPRPREIVIAWAASAAAVWVLIGVAPVDALAPSIRDPALRGDDPTYTVAAVTQIFGDLLPTSEE